MNLLPVRLWLLLTLAVPVLSARAAESPAAPAQEDGVIVGQVIPRDEGRWFGLTMVGAKLQLNFYDAHKQPEKVDRIRGVLRIVPFGREEIRDVMNPTPAGTALICNKPIPSLRAFRVYIRLIGKDGEAMENLVVPFSREEAKRPAASAPKSP